MAAHCPECARGLKTKLYRKDMKTCKICAPSSNSRRTHTVDTRPRSNPKSNKPQKNADAPLRTDLQNGQPGERADAMHTNTPHRPVKTQNPSTPPIAFAPNEPKRDPPDREQLCASNGDCGATRKSPSSACQLPVAADLAASKRGHPCALRRKPPVWGAALRSGNG